MTLSRRDFLSASAVGLLAGSFPRVLSGAGLPRVLRSSSLARSFVEVRRNVGTFSARGGTMGWLANASGSLVVDSQFPDTAATFLEGFGERGAAEIDALVNTHHHFDHTGGNAVFGGRVRRIVAHANVPDLQRTAAQQNAEAPEQSYADTTFEEEWTVTIGDETVRLKHYGAAHTGGDATVFFERANVVHMGDLVFNRGYPFIDVAGGASTEGWAALLEAVAAEHDGDAIYVFGHARQGFGITGGRSDILLQRDLLGALLEVTRQALAEGRSREEATRIDTLPGFDQHGPLSDWLSLSAVVGFVYDDLTRG